MNNQESTITAEELIEQMKNALRRLGPPLPVVRVSACIPRGQVIEFPAGSLFLLDQSTDRTIFVNPDDYQRVFGDIMK